MMERWRLTINYGSRVEEHRGLSKREAQRLADREMAEALTIYARPEPKRIRGRGTYR